MLIPDLVVLKFTKNNKFEESLIRKIRQKFTQLYRIQGLFKELGQKII